MVGGIKMKKLLTVLAFVTGALLAYAILDLIYEAGYNRGYNAALDYAIDELKKPNVPVTIDTVTTVDYFHNHSEIKP